MTADRPELVALSDLPLEADGTLVVRALDRLSRSLQDLVTTIGGMRTRNVGFTSLRE